MAGNGNIEEVALKLQQPINWGSWNINLKREYWNRDKLSGGDKTEAF